MIKAQKIPKHLDRLVEKVINRAIARVKKLNEDAGYKLSADRPNFDSKRPPFDKEPRPDPEPDPNAVDDTVPFWHMSEGGKKIMRDYLGDSEVKTTILSIIISQAKKNKNASFMTKLKILFNVLKAVLLKITKGFLSAVHGVLTGLTGDSLLTKPYVWRNDEDPRNPTTLKKHVYQYFSKYGLLGPVAHAAAGLALWILGPIVLLFTAGSDVSGGGSQGALALMMVFFLWVLSITAVSGPQSNMGIPLIIAFVCAVVYSIYYVLKGINAGVEITYDFVDNLYTKQMNKLINDMTPVKPEANPGTTPTTAAESISLTTKKLKLIMESN